MTWNDLSSNPIADLTKAKTLLSNQTGLYDAKNSQFGLMLANSIARRQRATLDQVQAQIEQQSQEQKKSWIDAALQLYRENLSRNE